MAAPLRLGLVGAGRWGRNYIRTLAGLEGARLAALASGNPDSAELVPKDCLISTDWQAILNPHLIDAVVIATPPAVHARIATAAVELGLPVLVEKPMTLSLADARALANAATANGVLTMVGHTHLHSAAFRELKHEGNRLGELLHTRSAGGNWGPFRLDTPVLWDWGPHDVAMSLDLFGGFPKTIHATRKISSPGSQESGEAIAISLEFGNGTHADIHLSNIERKKQRLFEATYAGGTLIYDDLAPDKLAIRANGGHGLAPVAIDASLPLANLVADFCSAIRQGQRSHDSLELGLKVIEVLVACQASLDHAG